MALSDTTYLDRDYSTYKNQIQYIIVLLYINCFEENNDKHTVEEEINDTFFPLLCERWHSQLVDLENHALCVQPTDYSLICYVELIHRINKIKCRLLADEKTDSDHNI